MRNIIRGLLAAAIAFATTAISQAAEPPRTLTAGSWQADDADKPAQLTFATAARADDPELFVFCDRANTELKLLYRRLPSEEAEGMSERPGALDGSLVAAGQTWPLAGFLSRAPEATGIGYDILVTANSLALLTTPDLTLRFPGFDIAAPQDGLLARFASACPSVSTVFEAAGWRRRFNLQAGFAVDIPVQQFRLSDADRTGRFYRDGPGHATLQLTIAINQDELGPREALRRMSRDKDAVTKVAKSNSGADFFMLNGSKGDRAVSLKALLTCGKSMWAMLRVEYDPAARAQVEPLFARMAQSLTTEAGFDGMAACE
ncbi:MAG: hypothetical protein JSR72_12600 [Proteobacteria bacterium]|nr:hypothetical protein [Pseudomonadota bacterium]